MLNISKVGYIINKVPQHKMPIRPILLCLEGDDLRFVCLFSFSYYLCVCEYLCVYVSALGDLKKNKGDPSLQP